MLYSSGAILIQRKSNLFIYTRFICNDYLLLLFKSLILADLLFYKKIDTFTKEQQGYFSSLSINEKIYLLCQIQVENLP